LDDFIKTNIQQGKSAKSAGNNIFGLFVVDSNIYISIGAQISRDLYYVEAGNFLRSFRPPVKTILRLPACGYLKNSFIQPLQGCGFF